MPRTIVYPPKGSKQNYVIEIIIIVLCLFIVCLALYLGYTHGTRLLP